jgi:hypothetical protein
MKRILVTCLSVAAAMVCAPCYAQSPDTPPPSPTSLLCQEPITADAGPESVGPTPEVCLPFIQWPPLPSVGG